MAKVRICDDRKKHHLCALATWQSGKMSKGKGKRLLLVTYYWPPSGGPGVQRWLKIVKYLIRLGWEVTVYTPSNPEINDKDVSLLKDIPSGTSLLQRSIIEPLRLYKRILGKKSVGNGLLAEEGNKKRQRGRLGRLFLWVRANLFVPDARALWIGPSVRFLRRWLRRHPQDIMVTTGPPHSMHLIGRGVHRATGLPWVADFRDPWLHIDYHQHLPFSSHTWARLGKMERSVVEEADAVTVVTDGMVDDFAAYTPRQLRVIYNGFDLEDFPTPTHRPSSPSAPLRMVYTGSMNPDRNPLLLWSVLEELQKEAIITPTSFRLEIVGTCDVSVKTSITDSGLEELVEIRGSIPHAAIPSLLCGADLLLLSVNRAPSSKAILTGKLFEYLASGRPIVALAPTDGEAARLIATTQSGQAFDEEDKARLRSYLVTALESHQRGEGSSSPETHARHLAPYTRAYQAEQFAALFDEILNP